MHLEAPEARAALAALEPRPPATTPEVAWTWRPRTGSPWEDAPRTLLLAGAALVVVDRRGRTLCVTTLDPRSGERLHERKLPAASSVDVGGPLVVTTTGGVAEAREAWTGQVVWSASAAAVWPGDEGLAVLGPDDLVELHPLRGPALERGARFCLGGRRPVALAPWGLLVTDPGASRTITALDLDGRARWRAPVASLRCAVDAGGAALDGPEGVELRDPDGRLRWRRPVAGGPTLGSAHVVLAGPTSVVALERRTGEARPLLAGHHLPPLLTAGDVALVVEQGRPWPYAPPRPALVTEEQLVALGRPRPVARPPLRIGAGAFVSMTPPAGERSTPRLRAIELATGRTRWAHDLGWLTDTAHVVALGDRLHVLGAEGLETLT